MNAVGLRTEHRKNPVGIGEKKPFLSWTCENGIRQTAYEISASRDGAEIWNSGRVETNRMNARYEGGAGSRDRICWRVRLWDENGLPGDWSGEAVFELGLLERDCWKAKWIDPETDDSCLIGEPAWGEQATVPYHAAACLRRSFRAKEGGTARLYITCHGLYVARLNGRRVGDFVLAPGCANYKKSLPYQTYDVTELLREGENELLVVLGDGWYRSCSGVDGDRFLYGERLGLFCQLEQEGEVICVSDEGWEASSKGPVRENDMQQGETCDGRREITDWHGVRVEAFDPGVLAESVSTPVREQESFPGTLLRTPDGSTVLDFGQNLAGYVEFTLEAHAGQTIRLRHGETLDERGNFTMANFQPGSRHKEGGIRQEINYTCREGINRYKPSFTVMGFRYVKVETEIGLEGAVFTAHAVYSDMEELCTFQCSDERVNRLVRNSVWSQKSNFCDVPTDCPTRERAGWTGDAGVFVDTGLYLMDCYPVFRKWLGECRTIQMSDGKLYNIAPPNSKGSFFTNMLSASVGWGDASVIVPWAMYRRFGDIRILEENYEMMKGWYGFLERRARKSGLKSLLRRNPWRRYTVEKGMDYGEWCEPGVSPAEAMRNPKKSVGTAYLAYTGKLLGEIARTLGHAEDAAHFKEVSKKAGQAYLYSFTDNGRITSDRQCEYVRALAFGLLDGEQGREAAKTLNRMVQENGYHLNTGFLSTPFLCQALAEHGYTETAYRLLLQDTCPGWLYAVEKGATTVWETWDGIREDGTVHDSLNHYSYGAVSGWLIRGVCGVRLEGGELTIAPTPHPLLQYARASYDSPAGRIESGWRFEGEELTFEFRIPANATARVMLPGGAVKVLGPGSHRLAASGGPC